MSLKRENKYNNQTIDTPSRNSTKYVRLAVAAAAVIFVCVAWFVNVLYDASHTTLNELTDQVGLYSPGVYDSFAGQMEQAYGVPINDDIEDDLEVVGNVGNLIEEYHRAKDLGDVATAKRYEDEIIRSTTALIESSLNVVKDGTGLNSEKDGPVTIKPDPDGFMRIYNGKGKGYVPKGNVSAAIDAIVKVQDHARNGGYGVYLTNEAANRDSLFDSVQELVIAVNKYVVGPKEIKDPWIGPDQFVGYENENEIPTK